MPAGLNVKLYRDLNALPDSLRAGAVSIGNFDGVHRGHAAVIGAAREAARAAGATPLQVVLHAILPQVQAQMADTALYRWEYNFRASAVMGAVGWGFVVRSVPD